MSKTDWHALARQTIIALALTILALLGYNGQVVQPQLAELERPAGLGIMAAGDTNFTNVVASGDITAGDDLTVTDDATITDDLAVTGLATVGETLGVTGMSTFTGGATATEDVENIFLPTTVSTVITWTAAAGGTGTVATIGDGEIWIVHSVLVNVTTDFDCTGDDATLVVGDGNDADGFIVLADAELQAADTEGTGFAAGWQGMADGTIGVYLDEVDSGYVYAPSGAAETIDWLIDETSGETITAGAAEIFVTYTRIQ